MKSTLFKLNTADHRKTKRSIALNFNPQEFESDILILHPVFIGVFVIGMRINSHAFSTGVVVGDFLKSWWSSAHTLNI